MLVLSRKKNETIVINGDIVLRVVEIRGADDLERDGAAQVGVEGLVGHPHRPMAELDESAVVAIQQLVVLEIFRRGHRPKR